MKIIERFTEPSTWAGFAVLGTLFGINPLAHIDPISIASAIGALAAIFMPEKST